MQFWIHSGINLLGTMGINTDYVVFGGGLYQTGCNSTVHETRYYKLQTQGLAGKRYDTEQGYILQERNKKKGPSCQA